MHTFCIIWPSCVPCKAITQPIAVSMFKQFTLATGLTRLRANRKQEVIDPAVKQTCRDRPFCCN